MKATLGRMVVLVLGVSALSVPADAFDFITIDLVEVDNSAVLPGDDSLVPDFNDSLYFTFDLMITTTGPRYFYAAAADASLTGPAEFFQHPAGDRVPPESATIAQYPAVEFDTYFDGGGRTAGVAWESYVEEPQFIHADWGGTGDYPPAGTYRIARYTVHFLEPGSTTLTVEGVTVAPLSPGILIPFGPFTVPIEYIPEPGALALLALGGFAALRRRR